MDTNDNSAPLTICYKMYYVYSNEAIGFKNGMNMQTQFNFVNLM